MVGSSKDNFKKLKAQWDKKLKESGFEDIEQADGNLKIWHSTIFKNKFYKPRSEAKIEYYRLAGQLLWSYTFKSKNERDVWALHCEGFSRRQIQTKLKLKEFFVRSTVEKCVKAMKESVAENE